MKITASVPIIGSENIKRIILRAAEIITAIIPRQIISIKIIVIIIVTSP